MTAAGLALELLGALCLIFGALYLLARSINNYGIVDIVWSYAFAGAALFYAGSGTGWPIRRAMMAAITIVWSLRLGTHLLIRIAKHHPTEDGRYRQLRKDWDQGFAAKMAGFFQMQALSVVVLSVPFLAIALNPDPQVKPLEWAGAALWLVAISGEALADAQLAAFKKDPLKRAGVCDQGLWRYSRHPNYFFEWLIWVAYFIFACASPWGWVSIVCPISILYLLLRVTGIPMTEEQSIRSRGDAYRRYQKTTRAFAPWFPRQPPQA